MCLRDRERKKELFKYLSPIFIDSESFMLQNHISISAGNLNILNQLSLNLKQPGVSITRNSPEKKLLHIKGRS